MNTTQYNRKNLEMEVLRFNLRLEMADWPYRMVVNTRNGCTALDKVGKDDMEGRRSQTTLETGSTKQCLIAALQYTVMAWGLIQQDEEGASAKAQLRQDIDMLNTKLAQATHEYRFQVFFIPGKTTIALATPEQNANWEYTRELLTGTLTKCRTAAFRYAADNCP